MSAASASHRLRVPDGVALCIRGLHPELKKKVRSALRAILDAPSRGKALKSELAGLRSYRIGTFRIVYRIGEDRTVELVGIGPRKSIYEATLRLLRREGA